MASKEKIFRFVQTASDPMAIMDRFHPSGRQVLNRTTWRGMEPRSCAITRASGTTKGQPHGSMKVIVEVTYRPKDVETYTGNTKYRGWTAMLLDRMKDGTLLDGKGQPLAPGASPVYLPFEMYADVEFNDLEFGELVGEFDPPEIPHLSHEEVMAIMQQSTTFATVTGTFMAPRKTRPNAKVMVSNAPAGKISDGWGGYVINVPNSTPGIELVLQEKLLEILGDFLEGRVSVKAVSTGDMAFVVVSEELIDCTPNEVGLDTWFDAFNTHVPLGTLDQLARQLMAVYDLDVSVVDGPQGGLLFNRPKKNPEH